MAHVIVDMIHLSRLFTFKLTPRCTFSLHMPQAIEEEGGNPDELVVPLEGTQKKTAKRTPKGNVGSAAEKRFTGVNQ